MTRAVYVQGVSELFTRRVELQGSVTLLYINIFLGEDNQLKFICRVLLKTDIVTQQHYANTDIVLDL